MDVDIDEDTSTTVMREAGREQQPAELELSKPRPESLKYLDPRTEAAILDILSQRATYPKAGEAQCFLCGFVATCQNRLRLHTRQHYTNHVCGCGESSFRRDWVLEHIRKERTSVTFGTRGCKPGLVYEVDRPSFARFANETRNPIKEFLPVRSTEPDTRHRQTTPEPETPATREATPEKAVMADRPGYDQVEPGVFQAIPVKGSVPSAAPRFSPTRETTPKDKGKEEEPRKKTSPEQKLIKQARKAEKERRRAEKEERQQKEKEEMTGSAGASTRRTSVAPPGAVSLRKRGESPNGYCKSN